MSQERTRFPIQPDDRRRSALSSRNVKAVPDEPAHDEPSRSRGVPPDKPQVPPHRRHERQPDSPEATAETPDGEPDDETGTRDPETGVDQ